MSRLRPRAKALVVAMAMAVSLVAHAQPAGASDPFGYPNPGYYADNKEHTFCYYGVPSADQFYVTEAMQYLDSVTSMYDTYMSGCTNNTDVLFIPGMDPAYAGSRGLADCVLWTSAANHICNQYYVYYDNGAIYNDSVRCEPANVGDNFYANFRKTLRHEIGHTTGLSHRAKPSACAYQTGDAMVSAWIQTHLQFMAYSGPHATQITNRYP